ncbi:MAG: sulfate/molybdate ABC transporter ATP-binding protein [Kofleriaceae bacterium]
MQVSGDHIYRAFGEYPALEDVSIAIASGELVALLGPSGSGKTTLLRIIAGIDAPDRGRVRFGDTDVTDRPIQQRRVGFVFQEYALFEHMTVADNIAFGLSVRRVAKPAIESRVRELIGRVQLDGLGDRYPRQLSGGQRQRVALARALAPEPSVLLLDEPFGALDARVRADLRRWLRRLHDELHLTSVFVTHDQEEALEVADRIVVMNHGHIEQVGSPTEVFDHPANGFVMDFLGGANVLRGEVRGARAVFGELVLPWDGNGQGAARAYVRGHDLVLRRDPADGPQLGVEVDRIRRVGVAARVVVRSDAHGELTAELPFHELEIHGIAPGARLIAQVRSARVFLDRA